jgi:hypothetical protein
VNPILISKEKQKIMTQDLEMKSLNPYQVKKRKHTSHSQDERQKIEALMHASYTESSFYNMYYRNSTINDPKGTAVQGGGKKLRFANESGGTDDSNFGLDAPTMDGIAGEGMNMKNLGSIGLKNLNSKKSSMGASTGISSGAPTSNKLD